MASLAEWVERKIRAGSISITGVSIGDPSNKATWKVTPANLQTSAQPIIDAFDPNDQTLVDADLDAAVKRSVDEDRLISAVVWTIIDTYSAPATKAKYAAARQKIIDVYKTRPWI